MSNEQAEQPKEYRIETVADFAQVPSERLLTLTFSLLIVIAALALLFFAATDERQWNGLPQTSAAAEGAR